MEGQRELIFEGIKASVFKDGAADFGKERVVPGGGGAVDWELMWDMWGCRKFRFVCGIREAH